MNRYHMGDAIRRIRKEKGITQEELAEGVCAVSTISKIENGSQVPNRRTFELLMERLGEPGYSFADFLNFRHLEVHKLRVQILEAMEFKENERIEEMIWTLQQMINPQDNKEVQFYQMVRTIWCRMRQVKEKDEVQRMKQLLQMTHPKFDGQHAGEKTRMNLIEILLLNNIAIAYFEQGKTMEAMQLLIELYKVCIEKHQGMPGYQKRKAAICANLAVCTLEIAMPKEAVMYCNRGLDALKRDGNIIICLHLLRTRAMAQKQMGDIDSYYVDMARARSIFSMVPSTSEIFDSFEQYMSKTDKIMIF